MRATRSRSLLSPLLLLISVSITGMAAAQIRVLDDSGEEVVLDSAAQRIISLAPSITELLYAVGAGEKLVGVVEYSDYPEAAKALPVIGRHDMLDMERILALQPELIIAWQSGNPRAAVLRLQSLGFSVYNAEPKSLASIPDTMERLATLAGTQDIGLPAAADFRSKLADLSSQYSARSRVSAFYQVWESPIIAVGGNELTNDIISLCGGQNIFADLQLLAPKVEKEAVLLKNPEVIFASGIAEERPPWLDGWRDWKSISAVSSGHLYSIPPTLVLRHGPRALQGAKMLCEYLDRAR